jgi:hypothetical protein
VEGLLAREPAIDIFDVKVAIAGNCGPAGTHSDHSRPKNDDVSLLRASRCGEIGPRIVHSYAAAQRHRRHD